MSAAPPLPPPPFKTIAARLTDGKEPFLAMATLISPTLAITADHVFKGEQAEKYLLFVDNWLRGSLSPKSLSGSISASIIARDPKNDFAVLKFDQIATVKPPPTLLSETEPAVGDKWECFSASRFMLSGAYITGKVDGMEEIEGIKHIRLLPEGRGRVMKSAVSSGAPVIVSEQLVGVITKRKQDERFLYAIPVAEIMKKPAWELVGKEMSATSGSSEQGKVFDEAVFFSRLSPSSLIALQHADGIRHTLGQSRIHMEHFIAGLFQKRNGPTRKALSQAGIDEQKLREIIETEVETIIPPENEYEPTTLSALPRLSAHVREALIAANKTAADKSSELVRSRHLIYGVLSVSECGLIKALVKSGVDKEKIPLDDAQRQTPARRTLANAGIKSDDPDGDDLLNIKPEVEALCTVLAAKDVEPPISLGLFGDWGSGKSFFMKKMEARFNELKEVAQKQQGDSNYCSHIVQLWFNAWYYMDTSLWASLATRIFDGLAQELAKQDAVREGTDDPDYERAQLFAQSASKNDELAKAQQEKQAVDDKLSESAQQLAELQSGDTLVTASPQAVLREGYRLAIQQPRVRAAVENAEKNLNDEVERAAQEMHISAAQVKEQLLELQGLWGYARGIVLAMSDKKNRKRRLISLAIFIAVVGLIIWLLPQVLQQNWLKEAWARGTGVLLAILGAVSPFIPGVRNGLRILDGAIKSNQELVEQARREKEKQLLQRQKLLRKKATEAQKKVWRAAAEANNLKDKLERLRSDRQMSDFIRQRQQSTDYTQYHGVISKARSDFEQLSNLLAKEKKRYEQEQKERREKELAAQANQTTDASQEGQADGAQTGEKKKLLPRIDRIILYIDDLDRCPEDKVVEVLQAVHLLLAFPLFVVVVGVDPRWLLHSLRQHSSAFRDKTEDADLSEEERTHWQSTPLNYLEKIFQIPFTLWPMGSGGFGDMIDKLTEPPKAAQEHEPPATDAAQKTIPEQPASEPDVTIDEGAAANVINTTQPAAINAAAADANNAAQTANVQVNAQPAAQQQQSAAGQTAKQPENNTIDPHPKHLLIKSWEREFMKKLHLLIPSPRATKRFINIYRLIRASVDIGDEVLLEEFVGSEHEGEQGEYRAVLLLLAILTGYPDEATEILRDLLERKPAGNWWEFIDSFEARSEKRQAASEQNGDKPESDDLNPQRKSATKKSATAAAVRTPKTAAAKSKTVTSNGSEAKNNASAGILSEADAERWEQLLEKLTLLRLHVKDQSCADFVKWAPKVARYSFQSGRVLLMQNVTGENN